MSGMRYIENEGALFRGYARGYPEEVYSFRQGKWLPYTGSVPKGVEWGELITEADAKVWIAREAGGQPSESVGTADLHR